MCDALYPIVDVYERLRGCTAVAVNRVADGLLDSVKQ